MEVPPIWPALAQCRPPNDPGATMTTLFLAIEFFIAGKDPQCNTQLEASMWKTRCTAPSTRTSRADCLQLEAQSQSRGIRARAQTAVAIAFSRPNYNASPCVGGPALRRATPASAPGPGGRLNAG